MITDQEILSALDRKSVLIIDDEKFSRTIVRRFLEPLPVVEAGDGAQGLQMFLTDPSIAMILCDFNMPVLDGLKMLKAVRTGLEGARHAAPILMLTGTSDSALVGVAMQLDVDGFIVKPISQNAVEARMRYVLTHPREVRPPEYYAKVSVDEVSDRLLKTLSLPEEKPKEIPSPQAPTAGRKVSLDQVPVKALLTADVRTPSGELLVAAGLHLSERLIRRLTELAPMGIAPDHVWIE